MEVIQTRVVQKEDKVISNLIAELLVQEHHHVMAKDVEMLTTCATVTVMMITNAKQPN